MLGARGKHQGQFRHGGETGGRGIEQKPADFLSRRGSTRLAGHDHRQALRAEYARQFFQLRALAAAVESFEGDEAAAMGVWGHSRNDKSALGICALGALAEIVMCLKMLCSQFYFALSQIHEAFDERLPSLHTMTPAHKVTGSAAVIFICLKTNS